MNNAGGDFWNGGFAGGNSNLEQPDGFGGGNDGFGGQADQFDGEAQDFPGAGPASKPKMGCAFEAPLSEEEEARVAQIEADQQQRLRSLKEKEEEEYKDKKDRKQAAKGELDEWYAQKDSERRAKSKQNKEEEWAYLQTREEHKKSKNPWEKIVDNIEINPNKYLGSKDVTRMRQAMLARKGDLKESKK